MPKSPDAASMCDNESMRKILEKLVQDELGEFEAWNQITHNYSDRFTKRQRRIFQSLDSKTPSAVSRRRRIMICVAAVIALALAACAVIEPIREAIITWYEEYVGISFVNEVSDEYPIMIEEVILPPLDEGWSIEVIIKRQALGVYQLTTPDGAVIYYDQQIYDPGEIKVNNDGCVIDDIVTNNGVHIYVCSYEEGFVSLMWENKYLFSLSSKNLPAEYLLELAERMCE